MTFGDVLLPASDDPRAVGFSVEGGSLDLGIFTAREFSPDGVGYTALTTFRKYTGLEGAVGRGQLQGVEAVKILGKNLGLKLNQTTVANGQVLDWRQSSVAGVLVALGPTDPTFRIGGSVGLSIADVVFGSATIDVSRSEVSGIIDPDTVPGGLLKGDLLGISVTEVELFIGSGASLNTDSTSLDFAKVSTPTSNDPAAVGFSVNGGTLKLGIFTARESMASTAKVYTPLIDHRKFTALDGSLGKAQLQGIEAVQLIGTALEFQLNQTSVKGARVMNWTQTGLASVGIDLTPDDPTFRIGGSVGLSIADVVFGSATIEVSRKSISGVLDPESGTGDVLGGDLLVISITQANLFIGNGATLDLNSASTTFGRVVLPESNSPTAVGLSVANGSLNLAVFTAKPANSEGVVRKYTGVQASLGKAQVQGVDSLKLIGTALRLDMNRTSVAGGKVLDWSQTILADGGITLTSSDATFRIGGSVGLAIADVVFGSATVDFSRSVVSGIDDPNVAGAQTLKGDLLSFAITDATLFIGSGARLNIDSTKPEFGTVTLPASNDLTAIGFSVSGGSLALGVFTATAVAPNGTTYETLTDARKFTGLEGSLGKAQLQGVDVVKVIGTGLVFQLNKISASTGTVLDWTQTGLAAAKVGLTSTSPTFRIGGSVGLSIADVVLGSATISVTRSSATGLNVPGMTGSQSGTLLSFAIDQGNLYIGSGAMLVEDATSESFGKVSLPTSNDPTAVGFAVSNASLKLGILTVG
ncbi:MAG: hypothetical protein ACKOD2_02705, partial [Ilumatobacteraceae bacterium]